MLPYRYIKIVYDGEFSAYGMQQLLTALLLIGDINLYGVISPRILRFSSTIYSFSCSPTICHTPSSPPPPSLETLLDPNCSE